MEKQTSKLTEITAIIKFNDEKDAIKFNLSEFAETPIVITAAKRKFDGKVVIEMDGGMEKYGIKRITIKKQSRRVK